MSGDRALQLEPAHAQEAQGDEQVAARGRQFHVGQPIPLVLTKSELADITGYSFRQIDRFRRRHNHPGIVELDGPGHPRFCGRVLKAWADGGQAAPQARQFFGTARRRD